MTGQIPPYGGDFRRESTPYHPDLANTVYVFKTDPGWYIRSDKTSKKWRIYRFPSARPLSGPVTELFQAMAVPVAVTQPSLTRAMRMLLDGVGQGFYATGEPR